METNKIYNGSALEVLPRTKSGRFVKGFRYSPKTEFLRNTHWREPKPYWDKDWLETEYLIKDKTAQTIAKEQGCDENNIFYFLHKFNI
ncbi:MAG: hypothetical protein ABIH39_08410, partial [Candidatus Margulisiibacteriota bacterium]